MPWPAAAFGVSAVLILFIRCQRSLRWVVRHVFILLLLSSMAINACDYFLSQDPGDVWWLRLITVRAVAVVLAGYFVGYLVMLLTTYNFIMSHDMFLREMRSKPYVLYLLFLLVILAALTGVFSDYFRVSSLSTVSQDWRLAYFSVLAEPWRQAVNFVTVLAVVTYSMTHIMVYLRIHDIRGKIVRNLYLIMACFVGASLAYYINTMLLMSVGVEEYGWRSIVDLTLLAAVAYALGEPSFLLEFTMEPERDGWGFFESKLTPGRIYLVEEEFPDKSVKIFLEHVNHGVSGLWISRLNPNHVREKYGLTKTTVLWLTDVITERTDMIPPQLERFSIVLNEFINNSDDGIVLLDGVEYLMAKNDFNQVLVLLDRLKDTVSLTNSRVVIPLNVNTMTPMQKAMIEREMAFEALN